MPAKLGTNIKIVDKEDRILFVVMKDADLKDATNAAIKVLAKTARFESVGAVSGDALKDYEVGVNMVVTVRKKKADKKKRKRLDDDDEA